MVDTKSTVQVILPRLSDSDDESVVVFWHKSVGDTVATGETLVEVQTEKAVSEIEAENSGTLVEIKVDRGGVASVGDVIALIDPEGNKQKKESLHQPNGHSSKRGPGDRSFVKVSPRVRKIAKEKGVDLSSIVGTGPNGRPTVEDIEKAAFLEKEKVSVQELKKQTDVPEEKQQAGKRVIATPSVRKFARKQGVDLQQLPTEDGRITKDDVESYLNNKAILPLQTDADPQVVRQKLKGVRKAIAKAMSESKSTIPHVTHFDEVEVTKLVSIRESVKVVAAEKDIKLTYLPYIIQALVKTLKQFPELNASFDDSNQEILLKNNYHIGIATQTENGLMVPVIKHADNKSIFDLAQEISILSQKAAENKLTNNEIQGGTCTISNLGTANGQWFTPIINGPETAILGIGKITKKPIIKDDAFAIGSMISLSLSYDHRVIDGILAQNAINYLKKLLFEANGFRTI
ncbi:2-oxo acid dehydrogenase subunit E2 [Aquibacillus sp. 3ASR75-11]|uniref:Dihydrolipoamide acetyltransferase component of pyruvate dehydrogenase complex n=1 Tax=Terrihalobacillus insolitus TaxID=2950438 RepID=A0A9X3WNF1_9BACI|nr:dihydrolipoamide acetyltransferase family protein [Terrihalobacillus insolitus]MDC3412070.1 2-oxo acid dehydrogenase subunit E2 [Terrihalobacillus insolitus]MDC3423237.1 2-oxo acid dehydrogenase subunit E2 [Terrihalobacillus insolitus]